MELCFAFSGSLMSPDADLQSTPREWETGRLQHSVCIRVQNLRVIKVAGIN
jgi:hypothetical protein